MKKSTFLICIFMLVICINQTLISAESKFELGVNLDANGAFVDIIKHTNRYSKVSKFDSLGWPMSDFDLVVMDGRPATEWTNSIDDPEKYRIDYSGRYFASFVGSADLKVSGTAVSIENKIYDQATNTTYFDLVVGGYPNSNHALVILSVSNSKRSETSQANSGITNLKIFRPGYNLNTNQIFTNEFIDLCKAANFAAYRFYNLQNIWDGEATYPAKTLWENRKTPNDACQVNMSALNGKKDAWSWEYIIELSNILNKDIWLNIYLSADSNYISSLSNMLKEKLNPNINIYIESSNELWSPTQATHGPYNAADAKARGINFDQNHARRTVELSKWFANEFGQEAINNRIRVIMAGQHAYHGRSDIHLNYIKNNFGEPNKYIYATSTALYFQSTMASDQDPLKINQGMMEDINSQFTLSSNNFYRQNHLNKAKTWNLKGGCTSYEGGPHLPSSGNLDNLNNQILAHRTSKMGEVTKYNYLEGWKDLDGGLAMYFTLSSTYNRYGCWGITDDPSKPDRNYKMQAVRDIIATYNSNSDVELESKNQDFQINIENRMLSINTNSNKIEKVNIYNVLGANLISEKQSEFSIAKLTSGLYLIEIKTESKSIIKKLLIQ